MSTYLGKYAAVFDSQIFVAAQIGGDDGVVICVVFSDRHKSAALQAMPVTEFTEWVDSSELSSNDPGWDWLSDIEYLKKVLR